MEKPINLKGILLKELLLPENSTEKEVINNINNLPDERLIELFNRFWKGSKAGFSHHYKINESNFSRWSNGKKDTPKPREAVRRYLLSLFKGEVIKTSYKDIIDNGYQYPSNHYHYATEWNKLIQKLFAKNIDILIFLDGDQSIEEVRRLSWIFNTEKETNIHVLLFSGKNTCIPSFWPDTYWCSWIRSPNHLPESTDILISMSARELHNYELIHYPNKHTKFIIISRDYFAQTLVDILRSSSPLRDAIYIDHSSNEVTLNVLFNIIIEERFTILSYMAMKVSELIKERIKDISSGIERDNTYLLDKISFLNLPYDSIAYGRVNLYYIRILDEIIANYLRNNKLPYTKEIELTSDIIFQIPEILKLKYLLDERKFISLSTIGQEIPLTEDIIIKLKCNKWKDILRNIIVQDFLDCDLTQKKGGYIISKRPIDKTKDTSISNELRRRYLNEWKFSIEEFCDLYNINKGNFRAFIGYKKLDDPVSCAAIRKWLSEKDNYNISVI